MFSRTQSSTAYSNTLQTYYTPQSSSSQVERSYSAKMDATATLPLVSATIQPADVTSISLIAIVPSEAPAIPSDKLRQVSVCNERKKCLCSYNEYIIVSPNRTSPSEL